MDKNVAVIGSNSMVGSRFCELQKSFELINADLHGNIKIDITDKSSVAYFFESNKFKTAVLFSAYTDVDSAENQRNDKIGLAWKLNVDGVQNVAEICKQNNVKLVLISTEFVFSGESGPYDEESTRESDESKISWYGVTKIKSEEIIEQNLQDYIILRITYPYRSKFNEKLDFARSILKNFDDGNLHPMFNDQQITPTFIDDVSQALELLINGNNNGIYHVASPTLTTPFKFAKLLLDTFKKDGSKILTSSIKDYLKNKDKAPRPIKGGLAVKKITKLGFYPKTWDDGINQIYKQSTEN